MAAPPAQGTGFVNLSRYLDANNGGIAGEANNLANKDAQAGTDAINTPLTPADYVTEHQTAQNAYDNLSGLTNSGSLQNQIHQAYGGGRGDNAFDTNLLGSSGAAQGIFANAQKGLAGLKSYLDKPAPVGEAPMATTSGTPASLAPVTVGTPPSGSPPQATTPLPLGGIPAPSNDGGLPGGGKFIGGGAESLQSKKGYF